MTVPTERHPPSPAAPRAAPKPSATTALYELTRAITEAFSSPNVSDSNGEPANVVDTLAMIATAVHAQPAAQDRLAAAVERLAEAMDRRQTSKTRPVTN